MDETLFIGSSDRSSVVSLFVDMAERHRDNTGALRGMRQPATPQQRFPAALRIQTATGRCPCHILSLHKVFASQDAFHHSMVAPSLYRNGAGAAPHYTPHKRGPLDDIYIRQLVLQQRKHLFIAGEPGAYAIVTLPALA